MTFWKRGPEIDTALHLLLPIGVWEVLRDIGRLDAAGPEMHNKIKGGIDRGAPRDPRLGSTHTIKCGMENLLFSCKSKRLIPSSRGRYTPPKDSMKVLVLLVPTMIVLFSQMKQDWLSIQLGHME